MPLILGNRTKCVFAALAVAVWLTPSSQAAALVKREYPPRPLPQSATEFDLKWQPVMDFDTDSCYNVPMIGPGGYLSEGLSEDSDPASDCRDLTDLDNSNAYARQRCNNGWCATVYDYYWEKDIGHVTGHRHDIEHVASCNSQVVWVQNGVLRYISVSGHGGYLWKKADDPGVYKDGNRVKVVYHRSTGQTHSLRFANGDDASNPENAKRAWIRSPLVSYNGFPTKELRDKALNNDWGSANPGISDANFAGNLKGAIPFYLTDCEEGGQCATKDPLFKFDYDLDEGSPGFPPDKEPSTPPPPPSNNMKVMVVGDSITHGQEGDFTWRYRIWQWFRSTGMNVDFVGPYSGTQPLAQPAPPQPPPFLGEAGPDNSEPRTFGKYHPAVPTDFDSNHFAVWGRQLAQDAGLIRAHVDQFKPDMLLVLLGFNDMGWFVSDAQQTLQTMRKFISEARLGNTNLKFAIGNVPQRSFIGGREDLVQKTTQYNNDLPALLKELSTSASPIELVDVAGNYQCNRDSCPAGYDGLHPNAWGEYLIAEAFSKTLKDRYRIGSGYLQVPPRTAPELQRNVAIPSNIKAVPQPMGVLVTWDRVGGVISYGVRSRNRGAADWQAGGAPANRYDHTFTVKGIEWEFQVRSQYGDVSNGGAVGAWSGSYFATADRSTPAPPDNISTRPTANGMEVTWGPVPGNPLIDRFAVTLFDQDTPGAFIQTYGVKRSPFVPPATDIVRGHRYSVWVASWGGVGLGGLPNGGPATIAGVPGTPAAPNNLVAKNQDAATVNLTWNAVNGAAAYKVYVDADEAAGGQKDLKGTFVNTNSYGIAFMFPGICVTAINGGLESSRTCVTPPKAPCF
ncbi:hypothetical protein LTR37_005804 [Vermiconidia calcicola]|uniref:Uncharacterized protein n=1 Tax=Vermiconidia calcicola TaxID=1690605 RepID=A0ACC3NKZ6_9PEZI|nr:hypothetical protein LTR37_005804 [Vermiconidia calcicola]